MRPRTALPYAQIPHALAEELSDRAYRLLGILVKRLRHRDDPTDQELANRLGWSVAKLKRALKELVDRGVIARLRRYGRRTLTLLYTLAGRGDRGMHLSLKSEPTTAQFGAPEGSPPPIRGLEKEDKTLGTFLAPPIGEGGPADPPAAADTAGALANLPDDARELIARLESEHADAWRGSTDDRLEALDRITPGIPRNALAVRSARLFIRGMGTDAAVRPDPAPAPGPPSSTRPTPTSDTDTSTENLIRRLRSPQYQTESFVREVADRLADRLDDRRSLAWYRLLCREVMAEKLPVRVLAKAFVDAFGFEGARSKGATFSKIVQAYRTKHRGPD